MFLTRMPRCVRSVLKNLRPFNFKAIRSDILGAIFQRLIAPEERHKFGQFYTHEDIVDVVNAFCVRKGSDAVLDPACGSGSFLVRAYHRKAWLGFFGEPSGADLTTLWFRYRSIRRSLGNIESGRT